MKRTNFAPRVIAAVFLLLLACLTLSNLGIPLNCAGQYLSGELSFANMLVESGMLDDAERNSTEFDT